MDNHRTTMDPIPQNREHNIEPSTFSFKVRSYEGDVWGQVSASGLLRYLEQAAIDAAAERGFGRAFHTERGSTWVIRRMTLQINSPIRTGEPLAITTWLSNLERVRGGREYRLVNHETGVLVASALAEWVYLDRQTLRPLPLPPDLLGILTVPGAPLGNYDPPPVPTGAEPRRFTARRSAQWYECDSHGHVNNSVYVDWLDEAARSALAEIGYPTAEGMAADLQFRGIHYRLDYKRAALPEDSLLIETTLVGSAGNLCAVEQRISIDGGGELLTAMSVYAWLTGEGKHSDPPAGW
jgi:YbgC/YbaW family acyl-CoA thioester hydrolase